MSSLVDSLLNITSDIVSVLHDTLLIKSNINGNIKIIENNGIDYKFIISTIIAVISVSFIIWDKLKRTKISGKVISRAYSKNGKITGVTYEGNNFEIKGIQYFFKLSINITRKNLYYKDVKVFVKYGDKDEQEGKIYWSNIDRWNFGSETKELKIPKENFLYFNNILEKDKTQFGYLTFFVDREFELYKELRIEFISPSGNIRKLGPFKSSEIEPGLALFENEIWKKIE